MVFILAKRSYKIKYNAGTIKSVSALENIDLEIGHGEFVSLIGP